jgi:hypothetical protein
MKRLVKEYVDFVAEQPDVLAVDAKKGEKQIRRFIHVATYFPLSSASDSLLGDKSKMVLSLLFAAEAEYVSLLCI